MGFCVSREKTALKALSPLGTLAQQAVVATQRSTIHLDIEEAYSFRSVLSQSKVTTLRSAIRIGCHERQTQVAIKTIRKADLGDTDLRLFREALAISRLFDHPNLSKFFELYEDQRYFHVITELCFGDSLEKCLTVRALPENEAKVVLRQVVWGVKYIHELGFIHRGIRPQAIAYVEKGEARVKLVSFKTCIGNLGVFKGLNASQFTHSLQYTAPEALSKESGQSGDIWAIGVLLYQLLAGKLPFQTDSVEGTKEKIKTGNYSTEDEIWVGVSVECKDLLLKLLTVNQNHRATLASVLSHPWMRVEKPAIDPKVLHAIAAFIPPLRLRFHVWRALVRFTPEKQLRSCTVISTAGPILGFRYTQLWLPHRCSATRPFPRSQHREVHSKCTDFD